MIAHTLLHKAPGRSMVKRIFHTFGLGFLLLVVIGEGILISAWRHLNRHRHYCQHCPEAADVTKKRWHHFLFFAIPFAILPLALALATLTHHLFRAKKHVPVSKEEQVIVETTEPNGVVTQTTEPHGVVTEQVVTEQVQPPPHAGMDGAFDDVELGTMGVSNAGAPSYSFLDPMPLSS